MHFTNSLLSLILVIVCIIQTSQKSIHNDTECKGKKDYYYGSHESIIARFFDRRKAWNTTNLGSILFKLNPSEQFRTQPRQHRIYLILMWRFGNIEMRKDLLKGCSVTNCCFTGNEKYFKKADVVVIDTLKGPYPNVKYRREGQKWVVMTDESPQTMVPKYLMMPTWAELAKMTNWTMTYRIEADVPIPYGRTLPLLKPLMTEEQFMTAPLAEIIPNWAVKKRDVLVAIVTTHVVLHRMQFLKALEKNIAVDVYGAVSTNKSMKYACPGHMFKDCKYPEKYIFYLSIEHAMCSQYITEKVFYNGFLKGAIPVILGAPLQDVENLLPPNSFIHVDHFASLKELADHLEYVGRNDEAVRSYHRWRNHFEVVNEHMYFGAKSLLYCRICEALNYNNEELRIYSEDDIKKFFDTNNNCYSSNKFLQTYRVFNADDNHYTISQN